LQISEKFLCPCWPGDVERDGRAVLIDDELKPQKAAALPFGVDDARDGFEKSRYWNEGQLAAVGQRQAVGGLRDEAGEEIASA
jgi:hypothetical protein